MSKKIKVSIMGGSGYASAELIKRLVQHPNVELERIASIDHVGENIGLTHRNFRQRLPYIFEDLTPQEVAKDVDLVFLTLPHKVSYLKVPELIPTNVKIIDFSGDYRTKDVSVYNKYYKTKHTNPENIDSFIYGLPEMNRKQIMEAKYVANPGCFPTAVALSVLPLAKAGLLTGKVRVIGPTGSSGSGVHPQEATHHPVRSENIKSYRPLFHQHEPEIEQTLIDAGGKNLSVDFIPMSAPLVRGILINAIVDVSPETTEEQIANLYNEFYQKEPFIDVCPVGKFPETIAVAGTNYVQVGMGLKEERLGSKSLALIASIDNLVKGAAGQAVQNMNLMYGFEETAGLDDYGRWP